MDPVLVGWLRRCKEMSVLFQNLPHIMAAKRLAQAYIVWRNYALAPVLSPCITRTHQEMR